MKKIQTAVKEFKDFSFIALSVPLSGLMLLKISIISKLIYDISGNLDISLFSGFIFTFIFALLNLTSGLFLYRKNILFGRAFAQAVIIFIVWIMIVEAAVY